MSLALDRPDLSLIRLALQLLVSILLLHAMIPLLAHRLEHDLFVEARVI